MRFLTNCCYIVIFLLLLSCKPDMQQIERENHNRMIAKLDSINQDARENPLRYFYANEYRLAFLDSLVEANPGHPQLNYYYALEHQNSLEIEKSIPILQELAQTLTDSVSQHMTNEALAVSYLRLAEVNNCFENYTPSNCILPFDENAVHQNRDYIQSSINHLDFLLEYFPDNLSYHWMYNLAHIASGSYPGGIDPGFLISGLQDLEELPRI
jgi:hypothetical protein